MELYYCCLVAVIFSIIYYGAADVQICILKTNTNLKSHYFFLFSSGFCGHFRQKSCLILKFACYQSYEVLHKIRK